MIDDVHVVLTTLVAKLFCWSNVSGKRTRQAPALSRRRTLFSA
jgi:hypothetical protein